MGAWLFLLTGPFSASIPLLTASVTSAVIKARKRMTGVAGDRPSDVRSGSCAPKESNVPAARAGGSFQGTTSCDFSARRRLVPWDPPRVSAPFDPLLVRASAGRGVSRRPLALVFRV